MSSEVVLLIIALILLPMIQQLLRPRSPGSPDSPDENEDEPAYEEPLAKRPEPAKLPALEQRPVQAPTRQAGLPHRGLPGAAAQERTPPRLADVLATAALPVRPGMRPRRSVEGLRTAAGLRRSIVLMAILGSCRAIDPHE